MKAIVCTKFGIDALRLEEVDRPIPNDDQVLIEIHASSITFSNLMYVSGKPFLLRPVAGGFLKPKRLIPGSDIAGRVVAVGSKVTQYKPGDEVYGDIADVGKGGLAEYVCAPEWRLARKPTNLSYIEAAAVPETALVALQAVRDDGAVKQGQKVLVYGASGGIGTFVVQIAKYYGAEVTGVCSTRNLDLVRSLGADHVIDYTKEDFALSGQHYDVIIATAGYRSIFTYKNALTPSGVYVATGGQWGQTFQGLLLGKRLSEPGGRRLGALVMKTTNQDLALLTEMIESGSVKPVIDKIYPLSQTQAAFHYYSQRHSRGKVVISVC